MIHLNSQQFHERIGSLLELFKPNNAAFEEIKQKEKIPIETGQINLDQAFKDMDLIVLGEQEPGTILLVKGTSHSYIVRINQGSVDVWQNLKANGLRGPLGCMISFLEHGQHESYDLEEGVMRKTYSSSMPLFRYNPTKPLERSTIKPNAPWINKYEHIYVWQNE